jgi:PAS domain S-box-containing protein
MPQSRPRPGLSPVQRFSLLCLAALVSVGILFGWRVTAAFEANMLARAKELTAGFVADEVLTAFGAAELLTPKTGEQYAPFTFRMHNRSFGPRIRRIKIWNREHVVVWADDRRLVGQRFPHHEELAEALQGETVSRLSSLDRDDNALERPFGRLLELYVPIRFPGSGEVATIFEIYQDLEPLYADIASQKRVVWIATSLAVATLYLLLFGIFRRASREIENSNREVRLSEERYRNLIRSANDGIISIDRDGNVIHFNRTAEKMFGYAAEEILNKPLSLLIPEQYRDKYREGREEFNSQGKTAFIGRSVEVEGVTRDGREFPVELSLSFSGESGDLIVTGILRDITERRALQEQLIEAERQATIATIAAGIGHELNNAITGLHACVELLRVEAGGEGALRSACLLKGQMERLYLHARNLLSIGRPQEPRLEPILLPTLLDEVTDLLVQSGLLKRFTVVRNYDREVLPVFVDVMLLEQVIRNLEINAAHAMEGGGVLTIATRPGEEGKYAEFTVADTGHGIPPERQQQIFAPFYTTKEEGKGTGLGLAIVREIVDRHGGYIRLESQLNVGTTVTVGLPAFRDHLG